MDQRWIKCKSSFIERQIENVRNLTGQTSVEIGNLHAEGESIAVIAKPDNGDYANDMHNRVY
jgi:hypothetical protein